MLHTTPSNNATVTVPFAENAAFSDQSTHAISASHLPRAPESPFAHTHPLRFYRDARATQGGLWDRIHHRHGPAVLVRYVFFLRDPQECTRTAPCSPHGTVVLQLIIALDRAGRYTQTTGGLHPLQTRRHIAAVCVLLRGIPWCVPDLPRYALRSSRQISLACDLCGPWTVTNRTVPAKPHATRTRMRQTTSLGALRFP